MQGSMAHAHGSQSEPLLSLPALYDHESFTATQSRISRTGSPAHLDSLAPATFREFRGGGQVMSLRFAIWGLAGGAVVDGLEFYKLVRRAGGTFPTLWTKKAFLLAEVVRLMCGAILGYALGTAGQVEVPLGALSVGASAPLIAEKLTRGIT